MTIKPLIGISSRFLARPDLSSPIIGHHLPYADAIIQAGGIPLGLPLLSHEDELILVLTALHGILFTGGEDLDPAHYGESPHPKLGSLSPKRDRCEIALMKLAYSQRLPTLAICRGIQVMNVALGGTLYQDLKTQLPSCVSHQNPDDKIDGPRLQHPIKVDANSHLSELLKTENLLVNSSHHQAIKRLSPELRSVATAPDGVIEAVEGKDRQFFLGVQCHPEALVGGSSLSALPEHFARWLNVFRAFVEAASKSQR